MICMDYPMSRSHWYNISLHKLSEIFVRCLKILSPTHFLKLHIWDCPQRTSLWTLMTNTTSFLSFFFVLIRLTELSKFKLIRCGLWHGSTIVYSTSNRPRATGKILLTTCKAWPGSDRKGSQQRAKVTNTVAPIRTNRKSLREEGHTDTQESSLSKSGPDMLREQRHRQLLTRWGHFWQTKHKI